MTNLSPIAFDDKNNPWFSLFDVCTAIGIKKSGHNKTLAESNLNDDERAMIEVDTKGGRQKINAVNESGMLLIISRSRKPVARELMTKLIRTDLKRIRDNRSVDAMGTLTGKGIMIAITGDTRFMEEDKPYIEHSKKYDNWKRSK